MHGVGAVSSCWHACCCITLQFCLIVVRLNLLLRDGGTLDTAGVALALAAACGCDGRAAAAQRSRGHAAAGDVLIVLLTPDICQLFMASSHRRSRDLMNGRTAVDTLSDLNCRRAGGGSCRCCPHARTPPCPPPAPAATCCLAQRSWDQRRRRLAARQCRLASGSGSSSRSSLQ